MRPSNDSLLDTIAALATPVGRSALALVRISGRDARQILHSVTRGLPDPLVVRHPALVCFLDEAGEVIDRGLATFFAGPASATGEDVAELSVHGSPVVAERLLASLVAAGARLARAGEFTLRAFLSGKVDLVEAEAIGDLIEARTPAAVRASARRLEGKLSEKLAAIREKLLAAAAQLTAAIDFAEDVGEEAAAGARPLLVAAAEELERLALTYETGRLLTSGCRVAILGRPNAGKSTLFNALLGTPRAIVTDIPGTTRDTLEATVDVRGVPVSLVDTAGLRESEDRVEQIGVARAREAGESADAILYVFDGAVGWSAQDAAAIGGLDGKPVIVVANKADRIPEGEPVSIGVPLCGLSPDAGEKVSGLLARMIASKLTTDSSSEVLGSLRQKDCVERARDAAARAMGALERGESPEYAATDLDGALEAMADLVGETTSEDVLNRIFSSFCIGK